MIGCFFFFFFDSVTSIFTSVCNNKTIDRCDRLKREQVELFVLNDNEVHLSSNLLQILSVIVLLPVNFEFFMYPNERVKYKT